MGRKKINCSLGVTKPYSFWLYPVEYEKMKLEFRKLKANRYKFYEKDSKMNKGDE